jgi:hypothetical protein
MSNRMVGGGRPAFLGQSNVREGIYDLKAESTE